MPLKIGASRDLPLGPDRTWDGPAVATRVFAWAGWPDDPRPERARRAFLCYEDSATELRGSYHLPFADVADGALRAMPAGVRAAKSRAPQLKGASADLVGRMQAVCDGYLVKMEGDVGQAAIEYRDALAHDEDGVVTLAPVKPMSDQPGYDALLVPWYQLDDRGSYFVPGALKKSARERLKKAPVLWEHDTFTPIGRHLVAEERDDGFYVAATVNETSRAGAEVMSNLRFGVPLGVSIGFQRLKQRPGRDDDPVDRSMSPPYLQTVPVEELSAITEAKWWESSPVTFGALGRAKPVNVRSALSGGEGVMELNDYLREALAALRAGTLDEDALVVLGEIAAVHADLLAAGSAADPPEGSRDEESREGAGMRRPEVGLWLAELEDDKYFRAWRAEEAVTS